MCNDCIVLHERLNQLSHELFQVKRANSNLQTELHEERRQKNKILREQKKQQDKQHYRNGQKRGKSGRNG